MALTFAEVLQVWEENAIQTLPRLCATEEKGVKLVEHFQTECLILVNKASLLGLIRLFWDSPIPPTEIECPLPRRPTRFFWVVIVQ